MNEPQNQSTEREGLIPWLRRRIAGSLPVDREVARLRQELISANDRADCAERRFADQLHANVTLNFTANAPKPICATCDRAIEQVAIWGHMTNAIKVVANRTYHIGCEPLV